MSEDRKQDEIDEIASGLRENWDLARKLVDAIPPAEIKQRVAEAMALAPMPEAQSPAEDD